MDPNLEEEGTLEALLIRFKDYRLPRAERLLESVDAGEKLTNYDIQWLEKVMKDGRISEQGTYKELLEQQGDFANFLVQYLTEEAEKHQEEPSELEELKIELERTMGKERLERQMSVVRSIVTSLSDLVSDRTSVAGGSVAGRRRSQQPQRRKNSQAVGGEGLPSGIMREGEGGEIPETKATVRRCHLHFLRISFP